MKDRKIVANDSENEIGCDNSPANCPDEFFEVAVESPKFHLNTTQDEFFSTRGDDSELNVTKNLPSNIFTSLITTPLFTQCLKLGQENPTHKLSEQSSACNSIDLGSLSLTSPKSDEINAEEKVAPETKSSSGSTREKTSPSRKYASLIKGDVPQ